MLKHTIMNYRAGVLMVALAGMAALNSCRERPGRRGILSVDKMKMVTWDILKADEYLLQFVKPDTNANNKDSQRVVYERVFTYHKMDRDKFIKSYKFYSSHPEYYGVLLDSLQIYGNRVRYPGAVSPQ